MGGGPVRTGFVLKSKLKKDGKCCSPNGDQEVKGLREEE